MHQLIQLFQFVYDVGFFQGIEMVYYYSASFVSLFPMALSCRLLVFHIDSLSLLYFLNACQGDDPYFNKLIRILATRCMTQVFYLYIG